MFLFPRGVAEVIESYCQTWNMQFTYSIDENMLNFNELCDYNAARACDVLAKYPEKIVWNGVGFCEKVTSFDLVRANLDKINWCGLNRNPHTVSILLENMEKICFSCLCANHADEAIEILKKNIERINYTELSRNPHPWAIQHLRENIGKVDWRIMCNNSNPLPIPDEYLSSASWHELYFGPQMFEFYKDLPCVVNWSELSKKNTPEAIEMLKKYPQFISWRELSANPHPWAIEQLEVNTRKIDRHLLASNPNPWALLYLFESTRKGKNWEHMAMLSRNPNLFQLERNHQLVNLLSLGDPNSLYISSVVIADESVMTTKISLDGANYTHGAFELKSEILDPSDPLYINTTINCIQRAGSLVDKDGNETKIRERFNCYPNFSYDKLRYTGVSDRYIIDVWRRGSDDRILRIVYKTAPGLTQQDMTDDSDGSCVQGRYFEEYVPHVHNDSCTDPCTAPDYDWEYVTV